MTVATLQKFSRSLAFGLALAGATLIGQGSAFAYNWTYTATTVAAGSDGTFLGQVTFDPILTANGSFLEITGISGQVSGFDTGNGYIGAIGTLSGSSPTTLYNSTTLIDVGSILVFNNGTADYYLTNSGNNIWGLFIDDSGFASRTTGTLTNASAVPEINANSLSKALLFLACLLVIWGLRNNREWCSPHSGAHATA